MIIVDASGKNNYVLAYCEQKHWIAVFAFNPKCRSKMLGQHSANTLGQRWHTSRWANVILLIGPTLAQHVGSMLAQHVGSMLVETTCWANGGPMSKLTLAQSGTPT